MALPASAAIIKAAPNGACSLTLRAHAEGLGRVRRDCMERSGNLIGSAHILSTDLVERRDADPCLSDRGDTPFMAGRWPGAPFTICPIHSPNQSWNDRSIVIRAAS